MPHAAPAVWPAVLFLILSILLFGSAPARAHPDVYAALPPDAAVVQYGLGDLAGDPQKELAVFFTAREEARLALFSARAGRWILLLEGPAPGLELETGTPHCLEIMDANSDGRDEILTHSLSSRDHSMITRILTLDASDGGSPSLRVLLEDATSPPGYPLFGTEGGAPAVTFLKMPGKNGRGGHRRSYCWEGGRFLKCVEVPWGEP